jgi:hypothetical protein
MTHRRAGRLAVLAVALALATDCTGDGATGPNQTGGTTQTPGSQSATATASPTVDALEQVRADLRSAQETYYRAYLDAVADPKNTQRVSRLLAVYVHGGQGAQDIAARMKGLADRSFAGRPGPRGYYIVERLDVSSLPPDGKAMVTACTYDDGVVYDTAHKGPDGKPITVNDTVVSGRTRFRWVEQGGTWKLQGGDVLATWKGENRCAAKSST